MGADLRSTRRGPGRHRTGSIRLRSPDHWELRVYIGPPGHGHPVQATRTFVGNEEEARSALKSLVAEVASRGRMETDVERAERLEKELVRLRCQVPARPIRSPDPFPSSVVYFLYFVEANVVKIGTSRQLGVRLATHDRDRGPFVIIGLDKGGLALEAEYHERFAPYRQAPATREWFTAAPEILKVAASCRYMPHLSHGTLWMAALAGEGW